MSLAKKLFGLSPLASNYEACVILCFRKYEDVPLIVILGWCVDHESHMQRRFGDILFAFNKDKVC